MHNSLLHREFLCVQCILNEFVLTINTEWAPWGSEAFKFEHATLPLDFKG